MLLCCRPRLAKQNSLSRQKSACKLTGAWERCTHGAVREPSRVQRGEAGCRVSRDAQARRGRQPHGLLRAMRRAAVQRIQQATSLPPPQDDQRHKGKTMTPF